MSNDLDKTRVKILSAFFLLNSLLPEIEDLRQETEVYLKLLQKKMDEFKEYEKELVN